MLTKSELTRTDLLVLVVVLVWGSGFTVIKYATSEFPPLLFAALRFLIATTFLLCWVLLTQGRSGTAFRRADWVRVVLLGLTSIGVYQALFHLGINYTSASNCSLLAATSPIWTALIAVGWGKERIVPLQIAGVLLSFVGLALVITAGNPEMTVSSQSLRGDILILLAAFMSALGAVLSVDLLKRYSALRVLSWAMVCGTLFLLPIAGPEMAAFHWTGVSLSAWMALAYGGVVVAGIGYLVFWKSIGEIGAIRTMVYNNLVPPVAIVIAIFALGEAFTILQALGAIALLGGVALARFAPAKAR